MWSALQSFVDEGILSIYVKRANSCEWTDVRLMFEIKYDTVKKKKKNKQNILHSEEIIAALSQLGYYFQFQEKIKSRNLPQRNNLFETFKLKPFSNKKVKNEVIVERLRCWKYNPTH